jgi:hypothetical protein
LERADFRRYKNGKFIGVEYLETRGILTLVRVPDGGHVSGTYYVMEELAPGSTWKASGERFVAPFNDGKCTRVSFPDEYRYEGEQNGQSGRLRIISARYAVRYSSGEDPTGDQRIVSASGTHAMSIQIPESTKALSFMRDTMEETFTTAEGSSVTRKGFILM